MEKNRIIIVEGPQGSGKTSLTSYLRTVIPGADLHRLCGLKDKSLAGKEKSKVRYLALLDYLKQLESLSLDFIFDRFFFSEEVYAQIGYKAYNFSEIYQSLVEKLCSLDYEIYLIILYLQNESLYKDRLDRGEHHNYQAFSVQNSINQQNCYLRLAKKLESTKINVCPIQMDDFDKAYKEIAQLLQIDNRLTLTYRKEQK